MKKTIKKAVTKVAPGLAADRANLRYLRTHIDTVVAGQKKLEQQIAAGIEQLSSHDNRLDALRRAAEKVEPYQPLYAVSGIIDVAARQSKDRAICIENHLSIIQGKRILDLGSSLGYMCFYFADRGAFVDGWEYNADNTLVEKLTQEINGVSGAHFLTKEFNQQNIVTVEAGRYDVALVLSLFHHIVHFNGLEYTQQLVADLMDRVPVVVVELAKKGEDPTLFWNDAQPDDELAIFDKVRDKVEIQKIGEFGNHLSANKRPLYLVSRRKVIEVQGRNYAYDQQSIEAYAGSPAVFSALRRRYYFADDYIIKEYIFDGSATTDNWRQIVNELNVLNNLLRDKQIYHLPQLIDYELNDKAARIVLKRLAGQLLTDKEVACTVLQTKSIAKDILKSLSQLRQHGLYHNDVRSWNVILNQQGAWLIDYGLAAPVRSDNDAISLLWVMHAALSGNREPYDVNKTVLPDQVVFAKDKSLNQLYTAVKSGEYDPATLLKIFTAGSTQSTRAKRRADA